MILKNNVVARVHFPKTYAEKQNYARLVQIREPRVKDVIGFTDGVSIPVKCSSDMEKQATLLSGVSVNKYILFILCL